MDAAEPATATLSIRAVRVNLTLLVVALVALDFAGVAFTAITGHDYVMGLLPITDLDEEQSPGTVMALGLMLASGILFLVAARAARRRPESVRWSFLGALFFFLALDEQAAIHERLTGPMREALPDIGILYHAWVVPYVAILAVVGLWIGPFILRQRGEVRRWFVLAAVTFLSGAVGLEVIGGWRRDAVGMNDFDPTYDLLSTTEEALELVGLIFLITALLEHLRLTWQDKSLSLTR